MAKDIQDFKIKWTAAALRVSATVIRTLMSGVLVKFKLLIKKNFSFFTFYVDLLLILKANCLSFCKSDKGLEIHSAQSLILIVILALF